MTEEPQEQDRAMEFVLATERLAQSGVDMLVHLVLEEGVYKAGEKIVPALIERAVRLGKEYGDLSKEEWDEAAARRLQALGVGEGDEAA